MKTALAVLCASAVAVSAQSTTSELGGGARDSAGLPVAGASLRLVDAARGSEFTAESNVDGIWQFVALPPGSYSLTISRPGFTPLRRDGLLLRVGDRVRLDLELGVGEISQSVVVTGEGPLLRVSRGSAGYVIEQKKVVTLPLDGRNFAPLIALSPGVNLPPGNLLPRINGSRPRVSEYIYDGISVLQPEPGQVAYYPIVDAIEEFRVETNSYAAEYGRSNGGVIIVSQKSGSNAFHGALFEFFRNEALNARNLFAASGPKPRFRRNQYGFVAGGPVQKNRAFFFVDWQGTRLDTGVIRTSTIPSAAEKDGAFTQPIFNPFATRLVNGIAHRDPFPGNVIPASLFDAAARSALVRYPAPETAQSANNYRRAGSDVSAQDQFDVRLDRHFGARNRMFARYAFLRDDSRPTTPLPDGSGAFTAPYISDTATRADSVAAEHTWTATSSSVNQFRFGFTRRGFQRKSLTTGQSATEASGVPNLPLTSFSHVLPTYDIVGFQQIGPPSSANARFTTSVTQLIDNYAWTRGVHSFKAGADLRFERLDVLQPASPTGNFQFTNIFTAALGPAGTPVANTGNSFASFLLGQVARFTIDAQSETLRPRAGIAEFFVQDDWRATRRLNVNLGVRYTLNLPSTMAGDRGAVFNLESQQLEYLGRNGVPRSVRNLEKLNFGPRVGLAYRLTDSLVARSGYALTWIEQSGITTPFTTPLFPFVQTLTQQSLDNVSPAFVLSQGPSVIPHPPTPDAGLGQGVFGVQRNNGSGYAQQWNVSLQKTLGGQWSIEAGYLGSKLTRLGVPDVNLNQLTAEQLRRGAQLTQPAVNPYFGKIPGQSSIGAPIVPVAQLLRPFPRFTTVALYRNNVGHSTYHSFQARVEKRLSRGLTFTGAYTFSRLIDDAGAVFDAAVLTGPVAAFQAADSFNKRLEKDVSTGNIPHIFSAGGVFELPFGRGRFTRGWQIAAIARLQSGSPVAVTQATNLNSFAGFGIQRPNRISSPMLPVSARTTGRYFDTSAFTPAAQFTIGNSSRNPVVGPGYRTLDLMIGKTFPVNERLRLEFRAEAFNITNTPPLGNPNGSFGHPAFGSITTALDPRVFELVVKLHF